MHSSVRSARRTRPATPRASLAVAAALMVALLVACSPFEPGAADTEPTPSRSAEPTPSRSTEPTDNADAGEDAGGEDEADEDLPDPADVGANELGQVPIIMYHAVTEQPASEYDITPDEFRSELTYLYEQGYRPIRTVDLVRGEIDVPPGTSPVVFTFDDTLPAQFRYDDDGEIHPESAVGILLDFAEEHPGFAATGSFYVTDKLFDDPENGPDMLAHIHELGFEVSNHTIGHANLAAVGPEEAERQLALGRRQVLEAAPGAEAATLSLPLGVWPEPREIAYSGSYDGTEYEHEGVLMVGAEPAPSPFSRDFDPLALPRIRSTPSWDGGDPDFASAFWLDVLENNPGRRYVSDGDPSTVSFPEDREEELAPEFSDRANPY